MSLPSKNILSMPTDLQGRTEPLQGRRLADPDPAWRMTLHVLQRGRRHRHRVEIPIR
jgi:hypothetical protein